MLTTLLGLGGGGTCYKYPSLSFNSCSWGQCFEDWDHRDLHHILACPPVLPEDPVRARLSRHESPLSRTVKDLSTFFILKMKQKHQVQAAVGASDWTSLSSSRFALISSSLSFGDTGKHCNFSSSSNSSFIPAASGTWSKTLGRSFRPELRTDHLNLSRQCN